MGVLADAALAAGVEVVGVIPRPLATKELAHAGLSELRLVESMHERKATMNSLADGFIALPGGLGTFEEALEVLTWSQLGIHAKPVGVLNVEGYYDGLLRWLSHAVGQGIRRSTGAAKTSAAATKPNSKTTANRSSPKPHDGLRSTIPSSRDAIPPSAAKTSMWTHVNMPTISSETESVSGEPSAPRRKMAVPSTVGV